MKEDILQHSNNKFSQLLEQNEKQKQRIDDLLKRIDDLLKEIELLKDSKNGARNKSAEDIGEEL